MANLNETTKFICGRNPLAKNNRPAFAHPEQQEAALWLTDGTVNPQRSGKAPYAGGVTEQGDLLSFQLDSDTPELNAVVVEGGTSVMLEPDISLSDAVTSPVRVPQFWQSPAQRLTSGMARSSPTAPPVPLPSPPPAQP